MSKYAGFSDVQLTRPQKSQFDLSHQKRVTTKAGKLTPVFITECVPSDKFYGASEILLRVAPLLAPIYDSLYLYVHFFFVPNRLLWQEWEEFITGGRLGVGIDPVTAPIPPYFDIEQMLTDNDIGKSTLADYLGVPILQQLDGYVAPSDYEDLTLDAMPFMAFQLCWYEYYRDRNFIPDTILEFPYPSGLTANSELCETRYRAWQHDYFNSALPFVQRGEEVLMPLAGTGSVSYLNTSKVFDTAGNFPNPSRVIGTSGGGGANNNLYIDKTGAGDTGETGRIENIDEVLLTSSDVSINDFRTAYALQVWLERNALGGSRYTESTQAHFGVKPQDSRLQRPEYIGGGRIPVKISEIVSTSYSDNGSGIVPLANMGGHGLTYGNTNQFNYFCVEHGFIIGIASIMSPPSYHQGLPRMFKRKTFLDYPWPTFAKLGEQPVHKYELYPTPVNLEEDADGDVPLFGYQSRYADWKNILSTNHGEFHDTLLFWTLTNHYADSPELGQAFTTYDRTLQERIFAVNGENDNFWLYIHNQVKVTRPLPYFATPNSLGFGN